LVHAVVVTIHTLAGCNKGETLNACKTISPMRPNKHRAREGDVMFMDTCRRLWHSAPPDLALRAKTLLFIPRSNAANAYAKFKHKTSQPKARYDTIASPSTPPTSSAASSPSGT